jgi:hypothetical protein
LEAISIVGLVMKGDLTNSKHVATRARKKYSIYFPFHILAKRRDSTIVGFEQYCEWLVAAQ